VTLALALDSTLTPTTETLNLAPTPTSTLTLPLTRNPQPSKVSSDEEVEKVSQEEERTQIATDFEASEDWLYEDGKASIPRPSTPTLNPDLLSLYGRGLLRGEVIGYVPHSASTCAIHAPLHH